MAVLAGQSAQIVNAAGRLYPTEKWGKVNFVWFDFTQGAAAGDAGSTVDLCDFPPGRIRILPQNSRISWSAFGAARVLDVGFRAYSAGFAEVDEAEAANALANDIDVAAAGAGAVVGALLKWDLFSTKGVRAFATVAGGTIPIAATLKGYFMYVSDN